MTVQNLLVFAHADEAVAFAREGIPHIVTGVGKIEATLELTRAIHDTGADRPSGIIVLGTAGGIDEHSRLDTVYRVVTAVQHDYSLPSPPVQLTVTTAADHDVPTAVIATGDVFVQSDEQRAAIASLGASLVDMESYAYARVCERLDIPLRIFKTPSDFADSDTTLETWDDVVVSKSDQLMQFAREHLPELFSEPTE